MTDEYTHYRYPRPLVSYVEFSLWSRLKAPVTFANLYPRGNFLCWMCGKQVCYLKLCLRGFVPARNETHPIPEPDAPPATHPRSSTLDTNFSKTNDAEDVSILECMDDDK